MIEGISNTDTNIESNEMDNLMRTTTVNELYSPTTSSTITLDQNQSNVNGNLSSASQPSVQVEHCFDRMTNSVITEPDNINDLQSLFNLYHQTRKQLHQYNNKLFRLLHEEWSITGMVPHDYERLSTELGFSKNLLKNTSYPISRSLMHHASLVTRGKRDYHEMGSIKYATMHAANRRRLDVDHHSLKTSDGSDMNYECNYVGAYKCDMSKLSDKCNMASMNHGLSSELVFEADQSINSNIYSKDTDDLCSEQLTEYNSFISTDSPTLHKHELMNNSEMSDFPDFQSNLSCTMSCNFDQTDSRDNQIKESTFHDGLTPGIISANNNNSTGHVLSGVAKNDKDMTDDVDELEEDLEREAYEIELKRLQLDYAVVSQLYAVHKQKAKETKRDAFRVAYKTNSKKLKDITVQINHIKSILMAKDETATSIQSQPNDPKPNLWNSLKANLIASRNSSVSRMSMSIPNTPNNKRPNLLNHDARYGTNNSIGANHTNDSPRSINDMMKRAVRCRPRHNSILPFIKLFQRHSIFSSESSLKSDVNSNIIKCDDHVGLIVKNNQNLSDQMNVSNQVQNEIKDLNIGRSHNQINNFTLPIKTIEKSLEYVNGRGIGNSLRRVHTMPTDTQTDLLTYSIQNKSLPELKIASQQQFNGEMRNRTDYINEMNHIPKMVQTKKHHSDSTGHSSGIALTRSTRSIDSDNADSNLIPPNAICLKYVPKKVNNSNTSSSNWSTSGCSCNSSQGQSSRSNVDTTTAAYTSSPTTDDERQSDIKSKQNRPYIPKAQLISDDIIKDDDEIQLTEISTNKLKTVDGPRLRCPSERGRRAIVTSHPDSAQPFGVGISARCICSCFSEYGFTITHDPFDLANCQCSNTIDPTNCTEPEVTIPTKVNNEIDKQMVCNEENGYVNQKSKPRTSLTPYNFIKRAVGRVSSKTNRRSLINNNNNNSTQSPFPIMRKKKRLTGPIILPSLTTDRAADLIKPIIPNKQMNLDNDQNKTSNSSTDLKLSWTRKLRYSMRPTLDKIK